MEMESFCISSSLREYLFGLIYFSMISLNYPNLTIILSTTLCALLGIRFEMYLLNESIFPLIYTGFVCSLLFSSLFILLFSFYVWNEESKRPPLLCMDPVSRFVHAVALWSYLLFYEGPRGGIPFFLPSSMFSLLILIYHFLAMISLQYPIWIPLLPILYSLFL